jgi:hypothetical protein
MNEIQYKGRKVTFNLDGTFDVEGTNKKSRTTALVDRVVEELNAQQAAVKAAPRGKRPVKPTCPPLYYQHYDGFSRVTVSGMKDGRYDRLFYLALKKPEWVRMHQLWGFQNESEVAAFKALRDAVLSTKDALNAFLDQNSVLWVEREGVVSFYRGRDRYSARASAIWAVDADPRIATDGESLWLETGYRRGDGWRFTELTDLVRAVATESLESSGYVEEDGKWVPAELLPTFNSLAADSKAAETAERKSSSAARARSTKVLNEYAAALEQYREELDDWKRSS